MTAPAFPSLAVHLSHHQNYGGSHFWHCSCGTDFDSESPLSHPEHQAEEWVKASTVTTREQLDALPVGVVVRCALDWICELQDDNGGFDDEPEEKAWYVTGDGTRDVEPHLPALLLHHPSWPVVQSVTRKPGGALMFEEYYRRTWNNQDISEFQTELATTLRVPFFKPSEKAAERVISLLIGRPFKFKEAKS